MGLRDEFLRRAASRALTEFNCGLDSPVYLRPMTKGLKSKAESIISKEVKTAKDCSEIRWITLRDCMVNSDAEPILTSADKDIFDSWDESFIEPIFTKIMKISGHTEEEIEEFGKN
jgi:hypothetical protein